jgi:FKBP-type peptidyl-prolyl cis-trans isomerase FklB
MQKVLLLGLCALLAFTAQAQNGGQKKKTDNTKAAASTLQFPKLANAKDSASYAYGIVLANSIKRQLKADLNVNLTAEAINSSLKGDSLPFTMDEASGIFNTYNRKLLEAANAETVKAGKDYLAANKKKPGVTTTASGLQYEYLVKGDPSTPTPKTTDRVKVHYVGTFTTGEEFDGSIKRGQPATFGVTQVIRGWTEALQLMHVGDKIKIVVPEDLAYGERGKGNIKPFTTLVFEIELLEIVK